MFQNPSIKFFSSGCILLLLIVVSCEYKTLEPYCETCNNFQEAFVIGFDPCTDVGDPNGGEAGFIINLPFEEDTVVTYNFPNGIYEFPLEYFSYYQFYCLFPDSALNDFPIRIKYKDAGDKEKKVPYCTHDIYIYWFNYFVKGREIVISTISK